MVPIVLYNSLGQEREYIAKAVVNSNYIALKNSQNENVRENNSIIIITMLLLLYRRIFIVTNIFSMEIFGHRKFQFF